MDKKLSQEEIDSIARARESILEQARIKTEKSKKRIEEAKKKQEEKEKSKEKPKEAAKEDEGKVFYQTMNHFRRKAVISAFGSLAVVLFLGSVRAGSCIISGSTERSCASETWDLALEALDARVCAECSDEAYESFDSRVFAWGYGNPLRKFKSIQPTGFTLLIR